MKYNFSLVVTLFAVWLLWSGHYTLQLVALGLFSCGLVVYLARRMAVVDIEGHPIHLLGRALLFWPWLLWAIVKANFDVTRRILYPRLPINPHLIRVKASQKTDLGRVIYANSITLTPGTVSLSVDKDTITVHALSDDSAGELQAGEMDRIVTIFEGTR